MMTGPTGPRKCTTGSHIVDLWANSHRQFPPMYSLCGGVFPRSATRCKAAKRERLCAIFNEVVATKKQDRNHDCTLFFFDKNMNERTSISATD